MNKWVTLILGALLGANANPAPHVGADNLLGAALEKDRFTVTDMGTYYSITRSTPDKQDPPAELVESGEGQGDGEKEGNKGSVSHK
jgi:hypothetical protein